MFAFAETIWQRNWLRRGLKIALVFISLALLLLVLTVAQRYWYSRHYFPNLRVGQIDLGAQSHAAGAAELSRWYESWKKQGLTISLRASDGSILTQTTLSDGLMARFDLEGTLSRAQMIVHPNQPLVRRFVASWQAVFTAHEIRPAWAFDEAALHAYLRERFSSFAQEPQTIGFRLIDADKLLYQLTEPAGGQVVDYDAVQSQLLAQLENLDHGEVAVSLKNDEPKHGTAQAQSALAHLPKVVALTPMSVAYSFPDSKINKTWLLNKTTFLNALVLGENPEGDLALMVSAEKLADWFLPIEAIINSDPQNAIFELDKNETPLTLKKFQPSRHGKAVDRAAFITDINEVLGSMLAVQLNQDQSLTKLNLILPVAEVEPELTLAEANDLGIKEVLGVGYSNFSGSPKNRVYNIGVGVGKLEGSLVAPGETFSLLERLKPFVEAAGYRPELVIKGDEITPEIGGGLCQIGSTAFRAAMNTGLPIVARRNHSLAIGYYNDPRNGLPGTDATLYDPAPDLKMLNDTGNYLLLTTQMNRTNGDLYFTFWGTSDGRKGSYTQPIVSKWVPYGETKYIPTTELEVGKEECQSAYRGAEASFTYVVQKADGTTEERVFESSYRALPKICLIGQEAITEDGAAGLGLAEGTELEIDPADDKDKFRQGFITDDGVSDMKI